MTNYYTGDLSQAAIFFGYYCWFRIGEKSGTYGTKSGTGIWPGKVQNVSIDENINLIPLRELGGATRNIDQFVKGPRDFTLSMSLHPQDFRMLGFALGSIVSAGSPSPYLHTLKEVDGQIRMPSMQVEVAQVSNIAGSNFIRTATGVVVNSLTITATEGEIVTFDVDMIAQNVAFSSGAVSAITANTDRPFVWSDCLVAIPSGTTIPNLNSTTVNVTNNFRAPHHLNGSEVIDQPIPQSRDYEITLELDGNNSNTKTMYDQYFLGGSSFNMITRYVASAGSRDAALTFSGCRIMDMDVPTTNENVQTQTITIKPTSCIATVDDTIEVYGF